MNRLILILLFTVSVNVLAQEKLMFIGEVIDFEIDIERFKTNGIYYFVNNSEREIKQTILFPFAKNTDSIIVKRVYNLTYSETLNYQELKNAIAFKILVLPEDTVKVNIAYSQKTVKENIYILESTQTWEQALKHADYSVTFDTSVEIERFSLNPDTMYDRVYYWKRKDFSPKDNFKVWIK